MKIIFDTDLKLELNNFSNTKEKIKNITSGKELLNNAFYRKEVFNHTATLKEACIDISKYDNINKVWDSMCGMGIGSSMLLRYLDPLYLECTDIDKNGLSYAKNLLSNGKIYAADIFEKVKKDKKWDLVFIDFNNFTLKKSDIWMPVLKRIVENTNWLLLTDSACFGYNKFPKNLKGYGVNYPEDYYKLVKDKIMKELYTFGAYDYGNSSILVLSKKKYKDFEIKKFNAEFFKGFFRISRGLI